MTHTKNRSCTGKVRYEERLQANIAIRKAGDRFVNLSSYKCKWCKGFHVGHTPRMRGNRR